MPPKRDPMLRYEVITDTGNYGSEEMNGRQIEMIRGVAWPRIHITFEAPNKRVLARMIDELNIELRAAGYPEIKIENVSRGVPVAT